MARSLRNDLADAVREGRLDKDQAAVIEMVYRMRDARKVVMAESQEHEQAAKLTLINSPAQ